MFWEEDQDYKKDICHLGHFAVQAMFGAGPVTGGSAGGKDYSFASMMGQLTPHDSTGRGKHPLPTVHMPLLHSTLSMHSECKLVEITGKIFSKFLSEDAGDEKSRENEAVAATGGGADRQDRLGAPLLSQGAQDYLQGAGVMQGTCCHPPLGWDCDLMTCTSQVHDWQGPSRGMHQPMP